MKVIIVTGTTCAGKTKISKFLAKELNFKHINVNDLIKKEKLREKYDSKLKTYLVDVKKLNKVLIALIKKSKKDLIIDSHLSHNLPSKYVDLCIVIKCDLKVLRKRLKKRKYPELKVKENMEAEAFDTSLIEAKENKHKTYIIISTKGLDKIDIKDIKRRL